MQIEQLASMPAELPPPTHTTVFDAAAKSPKIWSFKTLVMAKWRSRGALILYAAVGLTLLGCKMFWPAPQKANASAAKVATWPLWAGRPIRGRSAGVISSVSQAWYLRRMDVSEIAERTGIAVRQLRYAIYHTLVPGVRRVEKGGGAARRFTDFEAFGIALVAMLLESGLKREVVSDCMELLVGGYSHQVTTGDIPLWCAFVGGGTTKVEVADRPGPASCRTGRQVARS